MKYALVIVNIKGLGVKTFSYLIHDEMKDIINYINKEYSACMNEQERKLIALFSGKSGLKKRMQKVFWHGRFRMVFMEEIGYRMLFLIGRI